MTKDQFEGEKLGASLEEGLIVSFDGPGENCRELLSES